MSHNEPLSLKTSSHRSLEDTDDHSDHHDHSNNKRPRLHSSSPSPSPSEPKQSFSHNNNNNNIDQSNNDNEEEESQSEIDSTNNDPEDDLVLSEVHIHPDNGHVDGQSRVTIFHLRNNNNATQTKDFTWEYAIKIQHNMGTTLRDVGSQVWMGCFLLVDWMVSIKEQLQGNVALELGAGTGLASIALSLVTPVEKVFCTDYDADVLSNCQHNIVLNSHLSRLKSQDTSSLEQIILTRRYNWLLDEPMESMSSLPESYDWNESDIEEWKNNGAFIFAADVVYDDSLTDALIACLERFNFSIDQLGVVAQAFDYFVKKMSESKVIEAHREDCSHLARYCDYERSKDLMSWAQTTIRLPAKARGCHLVTSEIEKQVTELKQYSVGMANLFLQHTSASLTLNENADPDVRVDMEMTLNKLAPESLPYVHADEGPDDMPGHVKSSLFGVSLNIPITNGRFNLGTWQGISSIHTSPATLSTASSHEQSQLEVDHLVIGGGIVGLAIAERLTAREAGSTLLVEKNYLTGQETSSRNSEVIHAGIYYPPDSLKTKLCIRGNELMYDFCEKYNVEHRQTTKWVVGQNDSDLEYLEALSKKAQDLLLPTKRMPGPPSFIINEKQMKQQEPHVQGKAALVSPRTGIVDAHGLMSTLEARIQDQGGDIILQCKVTNIERLYNQQSEGGGGFRVDMTTPAGEVTIKAATVINSAGLHADRVYNLLKQPSSTQYAKELESTDHNIKNSEYPLPPFKLYYCKGHYYGYSGQALVSRLIYPVPDKHLTSLGTHLTLDLSGRMRFGPDVLFVEELENYAVDPSTVGSPESLEIVSRVVGSYLPSINPSALYADYAGIRPKLAGPGEPFRDFIIHHHGGFVNLVGIESPGLTSSLAIAEYVEHLLY
ncbi:hypothetical protein BGZ49_002299 [Haplosporangium sp. Z 27]|nr:hypothetical protein BGZ49_002299 [Haplosporangium sp. Z 27]